MGRPYQPYVQQLDTLTFNIGTTQAAQEVDLKKLEKKLYKEGEIANLIGLIFECDLDPTAADAVASVVAHNNAISRIYFYDGADALFDGSMNDLRAFESIENGGSIMGEVVTQTSTNNRYWTRFLPMGPARFMGAPSDFAIPCGELAQGGKLSLTPGVLTDLGNATVAVLVVNVYALLAPSSNELRLAPKYQRAVKPIAGANTNIADEALYAYIAAVEAAHAAFAAADFSKITVGNTKFGKFVDAVDAEGLARIYNLQHRPGLLNQVMGEPRDATYDVSARIVNFATATALTAQAFSLQPIVWCPPGMRMSKLRVRNDGDDSLTIGFSGAQGAAGNYLLGRFLPHSGEQAEKRASKAASVLNVKAGNPELKTLDKRSAKMGLQVAKYGVYRAKVA